jgi:hypothetical protein
MNLKTIVTTGLLLTNVAAMANGGFAEARCSSWGDNLNQPQAKARWEWAMKCDPSNRRILFTYKDYTAPNGSVRPAYPIYGLLDEDYEKPPTNPLGWFPPADKNAACYIPENYDIIGFCAGGCYSADQLVLVDGKEFSIKEMLDSKEMKVSTLSSDATLEAMNLKTGNIFSYMKSIVSGTHPMINIETDSGKKLQVTLEHPLVLENGTYIPAQDLKIGAKLLNEFGEKETIVSLEEKEIEGKVYNLRTDGVSETDRVIVAQGLLNGDLTVQQRKAKKANQVLLRKKLVRGKLIK